MFLRGHFSNGDDSSCAYEDGFMTFSSEKIIIKEKKPDSNRLFYLIFCLPPFLFNKSSILIQSTLWITSWNISFSHDWLFGWGRVPRGPRFESRSGPNFYLNFFSIWTRALIKSTPRFIFQELIFTWFDFFSTVFSWPLKKDIETAFSPYTEHNSSSVLDAFLPELKHKSIKCR